MKTTGIKLLGVALMGTSLTLGACSGKKSASADSAAAATASPYVSTDTVHWADSLSLSGCNADVKINGQYPSEGTQPLLDSVRSWLGKCLTMNMWNADKPVFTPTAEQLASGKAMAEACGKALIASARTDFEGFARDSITTNYEYIYNFGSSFSSDSVVTYFFTGYGYLGGAHGGTVANAQSFDTNSGVQLTATNMFRADARGALVEKLRSGLWEQYFKPEAGEGMTLRDKLLINPDTLPLPQFPPVFLEKGIAFTYQQYEIAPYAAGMPQCLFPYTEMKPLMTQEAARLIPE